MILIIDNYDSFTYNLAQQIGALGRDVRVVTHDAVALDEIGRMKPEKIIISPGPKDPKDSGISLDVIKHFHKQLPILGVCLGHQCIGQAFGVEVIHAPEVVHGRTSEISHNGSGLFAGLPNPFSAARYHSLVIDRVPEGFELSAWTADDIIMAIRHKDYPLYGIQFHPESFMTEAGDKLMRNFLYEN